jgi:hypothetical protein
MGSARSLHTHWTNSKPFSNFQYIPTRGVSRTRTGCWVAAQAARTADVYAQQFDAGWVELPSALKPHFGQLRTDWVAWIRFSYAGDSDLAGDSCVELRGLKPRLDQANANLPARSLRLASGLHGVKIRSHFGWEPASKPARRPRGFSHRGAPWVAKNHGPRGGGCQLASQGHAPRVRRSTRTAERNWM